MILNVTQGHDKMILLGKHMILFSVLWQHSVSKTFSHYGVMTIDDLIENFSFLVLLTYTAH